MQHFFLKLIMFSCLLFNLGVSSCHCCCCCCCCSLRKFYSKATVWGDRDGSPECFLPSVMPWPLGFCGEPSSTFQSHFGAYKVNTFFKSFISADEGDCFSFPILKVIYINIPRTSSQWPSRGTTAEALKGGQMLLMPSEWIYLASSNVSLANKAFASDHWKP